MAEMPKGDAHMDLFGFFFLSTLTGFIILPLLAKFVVGEYLGRKKAKKFLTNPKNAPFEELTLRRKKSGAILYRYSAWSARLIWVMFALVVPAIMLFIFMIFKSANDFDPNFPDFRSLVVQVGLVAVILGCLAINVSKLFEGMEDSFEKYLQRSGYLPFEWL